MFAKVKPNTQIIGQNIIYFNQVDSTNSFAAELLRQNMASDGTVVLAEFQNKGRGQTQKIWHSKAFENLLFSVVLMPVTKSPPNTFSINKAITLALLKVIKSHIPNSNVKIKWPNDIFVDGKKIAGILVENNFSGYTLKWSIVGIGFNVNQTFEAIEWLNATSLREKALKEINREDLLIQILEKIDNWYTNPKDENQISLSFNENLIGYQTHTKFLKDDNEMIGIIKSCDSDGRLLIEDSNRQIKAYMHGEITQIIE